MRHRVLLRMGMLGIVCMVSMVGTGRAEESAPPAAAPPWRSTLFPEDWTPEATDAEGRYLPDVSYAGYRNGEAPLSCSFRGPILDVARDFGADPKGEKDSTAAFQKALDVNGPHVIRIPAGRYRVDGLLTCEQSDVVLWGEGPRQSRVVFTRDHDLTGKAGLLFRGAVRASASFPLAKDGTARSREVYVAESEGLEPGQDIELGWVVTDAFIADHGMTGTWKVFRNKRQPFFRRTVVAVDRSVAPHRVTLDVPLRYPALVRDEAALRVETGYLSGVVVLDVGLCTAVGWRNAWSSMRTHALALEGVKDGWVRNVRSFASPLAPSSGLGSGAHLQNGGILVRYSKRVTIADCRMELPQNRGGGGCGYLFEIRQSSEILTRDCVARAGRHGFIQNWGFGTSGCVWLRCHSLEGFAIHNRKLPFAGTIGHSEYHHSLAMANVVDQCRIDDGWSAMNRGAWSSGAGLTATGCVFWNVTGRGLVRSFQWGHGYVVGTGPDLRVATAVKGSHARGSAPEDTLEGVGKAATLHPASLYGAQQRARLGRATAR